MTISPSQLFQWLAVRATFRQKLRRGRTLIFTIVVIFTLLSATVVVAQASQHYALGCQVPIVSAGGVIHSATYGLTSAMGIPIAPGNDGSATPTYAVRSANYGLRASFLPGFPLGQAAEGSSASIAPASDQATMIQFLPMIFSDAVSQLLFGCPPGQNP